MNKEYEMEKILGRLATVSLLVQKLNKEIPGTWAEDFWKQIEKDLEKKKNQLDF